MFDSLSGRLQYKNGWCIKKKFLALDNIFSTSTWEKFVKKYILNNIVNIKRASMYLKMLSFERKMKLIEDILVLLLYFHLENPPISSLAKWADIYMNAGLRIF